MGQHKTNLKAQLAAANMLPPKKTQLSKAELRRNVTMDIQEILVSRLLRKTFGGI